MKLLGESSLGSPTVAVGEDAVRLIGSRCPECGDVRYPARARCPHDLALCNEHLIDGAGTVFESVQMHLAPRGFDPPFHVGYIDLDDGARVFAQLDWRDQGVEPQHGDRVVVRLGVIRQGQESVSGPVFVPAPSPTRP
jgi:uncharacterized OB-fold protein